MACLTSSALRGTAVLALTPLTALAVSACGTTVQLAPGQTAVSNAGLAVGGGSVAAGGSNAGLSMPGSASAGVGLATGTGLGTHSSAVTAVQPPAGTVATVPGASAPGVPASHAPLKIGLMYSSDANAVIATTGSNLKEPDARQVQNIVVNYINKTGGLAGHRLVPAYYNVSLASTAQNASEGSCTAWTQDDHVFLAMPSSSFEDQNVMRQCLGNAHVFALYSNSYANTTDAMFASSPLWYELDTPSLETFAHVYATGLARQGFFKGTKIGLLYDSYPQYTQVTNNVLLPALRAAGADVVSTYQTDIHSTQDFGRGANEMNNAILQFRTKGVTNVMFFQSWAVAWAIFAQEAENQKWKPTYGFSSNDIPQDGIGTGVVPTDQLVGAKVVSWNATYDVLPADAGPPWPRLTLCKKIYRDANFDLGAQSTDGYATAMASCGGLLAFRDAARLASLPLTESSLAIGFQRLGGNMQSPDVEVERLAANRHYGPAGWRPASYVSSCTCFRYTGPIVRF